MGAFFFPLEGAVVESQKDPKLVLEYMEHGSLYDILNNDTMFLEVRLESHKSMTSVYRWRSVSTSVPVQADIVLPILRDITQGCRFLHASKPAIIHGDIKAANILVDSRMRAKVADFGLAHRSGSGPVGSKLWFSC